MVHCTKYEANRRVASHHRWHDRFHHIPPFVPHTSASSHLQFPIQHSRIEHPVVPRLHAGLHLTLQKRNLPQKIFKNSLKPRPRRSPQPTTNDCKQPKPSLPDIFDPKSQPTRPFPKNGSPKSTHSPLPANHAALTRVTHHRVP